MARRRLGVQQVGLRLESRFDMKVTRAPRRLGVRPLASIPSAVDLIGLAYLSLLTPLKLPPLVLAWTNRPVDEFCFTQVPDPDVVFVCDRPVAAARRDPCPVFLAMVPPSEILLLGWDSPW